MSNIKSHYPAPDPTNRKIKALLKDKSLDETRHNPELKRSLRTGLRPTSIEFPVDTTNKFIKAKRKANITLPTIKAMKP